MKDYSDLKWFSFIPWIGIGIIFFSVLSECRFRLNKLFWSFMIAIFIPAVLGTLIGELIFYLIADEVVYEKIFRMLILLVFMHVGAFVWCCIISRKRKKIEQEMKKSEEESQEGK